MQGSRRRFISLFPVLFAPVWLHAAVGADLAQVRFHHKDWEISCDNTRTCRAAGYQADDRQANASVLLTRQAGPHQPVVATLQLAPTDDDGAAPHSLQMRIGTRPLGIVYIMPGTHMATLSREQTSALLDALPKDEAITWSAAANTWGLSTMGANAVLLKMDEFQGRLDTPGALIRKGNKPEASVRPPLPRPVVYSPHVSKSVPQPILSPEQHSRLLTALRRSVKDGDCDELTRESGKAPTVELAPLSDKRMVVSATCWRAALDIGRGYWVANRAAPYLPRFITANGDGYEDGAIDSHIDRSTRGDCVDTDTWNWDGDIFIHTSAATTGLCRDFTQGGPWQLPTLVTKVRRTR